MSVIRERKPLPSLDQVPVVDGMRLEPVPDDTPRWPDYPETVRVMVVAPGPYFSTKDVWDGAVSGLRSLGVQVLPLEYHHDLLRAGQIKEFQDIERDDIFQAHTLYASHRTVATALASRPHLIIWISGTLFPAPTAAMLGQYTRTALWMTESPYQQLQEHYLHQFYRTVFTNERRSVETFKRLRRDGDHPYPDQVHYLPHAYDPARHYPREADPECASDVLFVGSPFPERQELLGGVDWSGIDFQAFGVFSERNRDETMAGPRDGIANDQAHRWYASTKININHHRTIRYYGSDQEIASGDAESLNPRVYELAAAECFQICDDSRPELGELFGDSVPTYRAGDSADLERVIRYWLDRPQERARLAAEACRRVQGHTFEARLRAVLDICLG